ncbi:hypothetical protein GCM10022254_40280 [Actinomadura meridiana]|uniref:Transmembrane protein n=1 Tax=Actinomadura meridiana TaxID=559626 RepID=A0ABP8C6T5_9ACTN
MLASSAPAGSVLAATNRLGDAYFMAIGPAVIFIAVIAWVAVTLLTSRKPPHRGRHPSGLPGRGPVQGGIIVGSPSQRTRRDPAPSVTHRDLMTRIERARAEEEQAREAEKHTKRRAGKRLKRRHVTRPR